MNNRDRLIELLEEAKIKAQDTIGSMNNGFGAWYADYLLDNGVIVPPCKVGDMVYEITTSEEIKQRKVKGIIYDNDGFRLRLEPYFSYEYYLNETVFLTREEAEKALERNKENAWDIISWKDALEMP